MLSWEQFYTAWRRASNDVIGANAESRPADRTARIEQVERMLKGSDELICVQATLTTVFCGMFRAALSDGEIKALGVSTHPLLPTLRGLFKDESKTFVVRASSAAAIGVLELREGHPSCYSTFPFVTFEKGAIVGKVHPNPESEYLIGWLDPSAPMEKLQAALWVLCVRAPMLSYQRATELGEACHDLQARGMKELEIPLKKTMDRIGFAVRPRLALISA